MTFRHDINFLRAIAVLLVVLYHFSVPGFSAGYIGVDVFFVISGYLITGMILTAGQDFSYLEFCLSRARRIMPALIFLCFCLLLYGWVELSPSAYSSAALHSVSSLLFFSNFVYWGESGYFDVASHGKWLLHTWSLSVEWQFYLLYPFLISFAVRFLGIRRVKYFLAFLCLTSFLLCWYLSEDYQSAAFYMLPTRSWEMLFGGLAFYWSMSRGGDVVKLGALLGLIGFSFSMGQFANWPGFVALFPVLMAFLFVSTSQSRFSFSGGRLFGFIGDVSYSFYLWHWPFAVLSFGMGWGYKISAILIAFAISCFSYYFVERAFRLNRALFPVAIGLLVILASIASFIHVQEGVPSRVRADLGMIDKERVNKNPLSVKCNVYPKNTNAFPGCIYGGDGKNVALAVVGDSHSNAIVTAVSKAFGPASGGVLFMGADGCRPLIAWRSDYFKDCADYNLRVIDRLNKLYPDVPVLVISRTTSALMGVPPGYIEGIPSSDARFVDLYLSTYKEELCSLSASRKIYVLGQIPEMPGNVPDLLIKSIKDGAAGDIYSTTSDYMSRHSRLLDMLEGAVEDCGVVYLDILPYMCERGRCSGVDKGLPIYYDDTHLTEYGNRKLVPLFKNVFGVGL